MSLVCQSLRHGCAAPPFHSSTWSPRFVRKAHLRCSLFHWGLRTGLRFAGPVFRGCGALRAVPQFSMVVPLRSQTRLRHSLLHWAYFGLFRAQRAAFVRPCANACAVFRPCGLRFAPCPRGSSRFAASDTRELVCSSPCLTGLTTACFRHWRRPSCAPFPFGKKKALGQGYFIR